MAGFTTNTIIWAGLGGIIPTLLWLWFWLERDHRNPEPRSLILLIFIAGALSVALVLPLEQWLFDIFPSETIQIVAFATVEEIVKFLVVALLIFASPQLNEPIDYVVYLTTGALGFAALENTLFLLTPIADNNILLSLQTGNLRFLGATLVHGLSAAVVGIFLALAFKYRKSFRVIHGLIGLVLASGLHAIFNFFIIHNNEYSVTVTIGVLWVFFALIAVVVNKIRYLGPAMVPIRPIRHELS